MPTPLDIVMTVLLLARGACSLPYPCEAKSAPAKSVAAATARHRLGPDIKITRTPNAFSGVAPSSKRYTVACKIKAIAKFKDRSGKPLRSAPIEIALPTITIDDGESVTIQTSEQRRFEIARTEKGGVPISRDIWEGTKVEICVVGADDGRVVVDVNAVMQSANGTAENSSRAANDARSICVNSTSWRLIKSAKLGETAKESFPEDVAIEVVVKEDKPASGHDSMPLPRPLLR